MHSERVHVLFVDDSPVVLEEVEAALIGRGYDVTTVTTLPAACTRVHDADIVVVDYHMPGTDGVGALRAMRLGTERSGRLTLFYLYTSDREVATTYKALGFDGAFTEKGDASALPAQLAAAVRMLNLKRFREQRSKG